MKIKKNCNSCKYSKITDGAEPCVECSVVWGRDYKNQYEPNPIVVELQRENEELVKNLTDIVVLGFIDESKEFKVEMQELIDRVRAR